MLKKYFIIGICLTTYGCFTPSMDMKAKVSNKANYDSAIPIDFIFIFNDKAFDEIKKLSAYDWFLKKEPRPSKNRYCFTTWNYFTKDSPLISSGLLGPVRLMKVK